MAELEHLLAAQWATGLVPGIWQLTPEERRPEIRARIQARSALIERAWPAAERPLFPVPAYPPGYAEGLVAMIMGHRRRYSPRMTHDHEIRCAGRPRTGEKVPGQRDLPVRAPPAALIIAAHGPAG